MSRAMKGTSRLSRSSLATMTAPFEPAGFGQGGGELRPAV